MTWRILSVALPVGAEDVVAVGCAGRVEGRRATAKRDDAGAAVTQTDTDAGGSEALRQHGTGRIDLRGNLVADGPGLGLPTRIVPPAPRRLPGRRLSAEGDGV